MAFARQLHPAHFHPGRNSIRLPPFPHPDLSHPESGYRHLHPAPHPPPDDIRNSGSGWERGRFNFFDQPCPDPPWRLPGSLQAEGRMLHSCSVLLKLPDICDTLEAKHRKLKANFAAVRVQLVDAKIFRSSLECLRNLADTIFHLRNGP